MSNRWVNFVVLTTLTLGGVVSVSGQEFGGGVVADDPGQPNEDDFFNFGDDSQQPNAEEQALRDAETDRLNQEAAALTEQGDPMGALDLYEEAIRSNPNFTSFLGRARILMEQDELQEAISSYGRAAQFSGTVEDQSQVLPAFLELGQAYLDNEEFNQALAAFGAAYQQPNQSRNAEVLYKLGLATTEFALNQQIITAQARQEQLEQGLAYFDKALRIDPNYADALYERGNTHLMLGDADKALEDLSQAVQNAPDNTDALFQLGFVSVQRGLAEASRRKGESAKILFDLNRGVEQLTRWLEVVPEDEEVDEDDPDAIRRENVLLNRSAGFIGLGNEAADGGLEYFQKAVTDADAAIEIDPEKGDAYFQRGLALRLQGEFAGAVEAFTETVELSATSSELSEALLRRGIVYFRQNDLELARADLEKAIRFTPRGLNPRAYFWLGLCYQTLGDKNRAVLEYSRALAISPTYLTAYLNRGLAYMEQGRFERATSDFNEVLRMDGAHAEARSLREQSMKLASAE